MYDTFSVPSGRLDVVMTGETPFILILNGLVTFPATLLACTVKLKVPFAVGVPEITPLVERVNPVGKSPAVFVQVIGVVPVADSV